MKPHKEYIKAKQAFLAGKKCAVYPTLKAVEVHHTSGRIGQLLNDQSKWLAVSTQGHRWIHMNIKEAREFGWICPHGQWNSTPRTKNKLRPEV